MKIAPVLLLTALLPLQLWSDVAARRTLDLNELKLPPGFEISIYARNLGAPRLVAVSPNDILFVSEIGSAGRIWAIPEAGRAVVFASGLRQPHGLAFRGNDLYVAETGRIIVFRNAGNPSLTAGAPEALAPLPTGGQHTTRTILWDADGKLIATAGSTCNICNETDERRAAAMRFDPESWRMEIFARGLRNSVGMALHPITNEVWATDNGGDNIGDDQPPEEINILHFGKDYGWPRCFGDDGRYAPFTGDCSSTERPELKMQAHSAPLGIGFYLGDMFPLRYKNDAFVAFHGSWNRTEPTGYKLVRVLASSGRAASLEDFLTGFLRLDGSRATTSGRPVHAVTGPGGALFLTDDMNGILYRISYAGPRINQDGIVAAAAKVSGLAPGSLASLYGTNLKPQAVQATAVPLPLSLEDVTVTINGVKAPLLYAGPQQVNFQIPFGLSGPIEVAVSNGRATDTMQTELRTTSPAIFTADQSGTGLAAFTVTGNVISIYCTGLGEVNPPVPSGAAAPRSPLSQVVNPVAATIDGQPAQVTFAGLAPDFVGLYQVNVIIPAAAGRGRRTLVLSSSGAVSNLVEVILP